MRPIFFLYGLMFYMYHFSGTTPTRYTPSISTTNGDSTYIGVSGHTGVLADSLADSAFVALPVFATQSLQGGQLDVGVFDRDTSVDSILVYQNHVKIYSAKLGTKNNALSNIFINDIHFYWQPTFRTFQGIPELFEFIPKMKKRGTSTAKTVRFNLNFYSWSL